MLSSFPDVDDTNPGLVTTPPEYVPAHTTPSYVPASVHHCDAVRALGQSSLSVGRLVKVELRLRLAFRRMDW
jgi:hypothetical protein